MSYKKATRLAPSQTFVQSYGLLLVQDFMTKVGKLYIAVLLFILNKPSAIFKKLQRILS